MDDGDLLPWVELGRRFVEPIAIAAESPEAAEALLAELGYLTPGEVTALHELGGGIGMLVGAIDALIEAIDAGDEEAALVALAELAVGLGRTFAGLDTVVTRLEADFAGSGLLTDTDILAELPRKVADHLVVSLLENYYPTLFASLLLVGVVDVEDIEDTPTAFHAEYRRRTVDWEGIPDLLSDPIGSLKANLRDGDAFLYERLLFFLRALAVSRGIVASYDVPDGAALQTINDGTDLTTRDDYDELTNAPVPDRPRPRRRARPGALPPHRRRDGSARRAWAPRCASAARSRSRSATTGGSSSRSAPRSRTASASSSTRTARRGS